MNCHSYLVVCMTVLAYLEFAAVVPLVSGQQVQQDVVTGRNSGSGRVIHWNEARGPREKLVNLVDFSFWKANNEIEEILEFTEKIAEDICFLQRQTEQLQVACVSTSIITFICMLPMTILLCVTSRKYLELSEHVY